MREELTEYFYRQQEHGVETPPTNGPAACRDSVLAS